MRSRLLPLVAIAVISCGDNGTEPEPLTMPEPGRYSLAAIDGAALPREATYRADCPMQVEEGYLELGSDGTFTLEYLGPHECPSGELGDTVYAFYAGAYNVRGDSLAMSINAENLGLGIITFEAGVAPHAIHVRLPTLPVAEPDTFIATFGR